MILSKNNKINTLNIALMVLSWMMLLISNIFFKPDKRNGLTYFIVVLLPTLIHMYVFTGFFLLNGALKSRSKTGVWAVLAFIICPILLFNLFQEYSFVSATQYGMDSYRADGDGFFPNNISYLQELFSITFQQGKDATGNLLFYADTLKPAIDYDKASFFIFHSKTGILLMRLIAFAYLYHYLNWFSKTEVIKWHKVPKVRFAVVIILCIFSMTLYAYNYSVGIRWLYFLSFCHILLEFLLNTLTITSISKELLTTSKKGFTMNTLKHRNNYPLIKI